MAGNESDAADGGFLAGEQTQAIPPVQPERDEVRGWKSRGTVLARVFHNSLSGSGIGKRKLDPNLWKLDYQGILSILRAEAVRARFKATSPETAEGTEPFTGDAPAGDSHLRANDRDRA